ncbi:hypothetical protein [Absicoccus intestinalis]|uniref:Uncharacterized protein n=1 Tax=Absicoccus intestinalis TaxID=2926319 RepID=A0ABU4WPN7_9FIRM|nr:hypothetical protein [Absicoccus sp. CLA-KB-P134]MDX8417374.1 hypothetical protein [Absicoccus sp. CLA-KB-P134]
MIDKYLTLRNKKDALLDQYSKANKEEKAIIKKEYEKIDDQMRSIKKSLPEKVWKQL